MKSTIRVLTLSLIFLTGDAVSALADTCSSFQECRLKYAASQRRLRLLEMEYNTVLADLNQCRLDTLGAGSASDGRIDLLLKLNGLQMKAHFEVDEGSWNVLGSTVVQFRLFNNQLLSTMDSHGKGALYVKRSVAVGIPDRYGEYVSLYSPHYVNEKHPSADYRNKACDYQVVMDASGAVVRLEIVSQRYHCPSTYERVGL